MEILIKPESKGILYEGYENEYIQCVFEDGDVSGRNERYEFRCRPDLECCGRVCCVPQEATVPFWLMILFIVLALLLLFALLGTIAWLCSKRKPKPKVIKPQKEKFIPSPMEEQMLKTPEPKKVIEHYEDEISSAALPETVDPAPLQPQRAQIAYYRPFVPDPMEETQIAQPERQSVSYHDISELLGASKQPSVSTLERPKQKKAEVMYCRPGFDNVPSY